MHRVPRIPHAAAFIAIALALAAPALAVDTIYDSPSASNTGGLKGVIQGVKEIEAVIVVEPTEAKAYKAHVVGSGFEISGLPPGEYDLMIVSAGQVHEGFTLETPADDSSGDPPPPPTESELKAICDGCAKTFFDQEPFFNSKRIVRLTGSGDGAKMFTMMTRTNPVLDPAGNAINAYIRRYDIFELVRTGKLWQIKSNRHLMRYEIPHGSPNEKPTFSHSPSLGGLLVGQAVKDLGVIDLDKAKLPKAKRPYASRDGETK
ncbi:MAG: hypothetical protein NTW19_02380 [Planctomycetota bacterium]|nr:hypothetical protein [Planctomycetota bacterium]